MILFSLLLIILSTVATAQEQSNIMELYFENYTCSDAVRNGSCLVVSEFCESDSMIPYYDVLFCTFESAYYLGIFILLIVTFFLFIWLGVAAENAFCPSLSYISEFLRLSQNIAGVTLLAFGNGAADLFSSFSAFQGSSAELSLGALLGAGLFVTSIVTGTVAFYSPFKVTRRPFIRDVGFYLLSVICLLIFLLDEKLVLWETLTLVSIYVVYVLVVVIGRKIYSMQKEKKQDGNTYQPVSEEVEDWVVVAGSPDKSQRSSQTTDINSTKKANEEDPTTRKRGFSFDSKTYNTFRVSLRSKDFMSRSSLRVTTYKHRKESEIEIGPNLGINKASFKARVTEAFILGGGSIPLFHEIMETERDISETRHLIELLFPIINEWPDKSIIDKILGIISVPIIFLTVITVPIVEKIEGEKNQWVPWWNRYLFSLQLAIIPTFYAFGFGFFNAAIDALKMRVWHLTLIFGVIIGSIHMIFSTKYPPRYYMLFSILGFASSIVWIYKVADELVAILETLGTIFGLSYTILGLTVLAWGNSIADYVSNVSVAKMGFPGMAVSACFGGPMLNLLLGIGISGSYVIITSETEDFIPISLNPSLLLSISALIFILAANLLMISLNGFGAGKPYGIFLLVVFVIVTVVNVLEEFLHFF